MDMKTQVREFLSTRRAKLTPEQAGLPSFGGTRRVAGLRREEVAMLAGVSVDYYVRLERGNLSGVSESVLESLCRALQLTDVERSHLFDLAHNANASAMSVRRRMPSRRVRPNVQRLLDAVDAPAIVRNGRADVLAANRLGRALYAPMYLEPNSVPNTARFTFLDARALDFYPDWNRVASDSVAVLRADAGRNPYDKGLTDLIGELSTLSEEFRVRWAAHDVAQHQTGTKSMNHPIVGGLELTYEAMQLIADEGLTLIVYGAEPDSATAESLVLLAAWAATEAAAAAPTPTA